MTAQIARRQFTVADYARMREIAILAEDDRVELIDGEVREIVEQYWQPRNGKYLLKRLVERGDMIAAQSVAKLEIAVDAIFD